MGGRDRGYFGLWVLRAATFLLPYGKVGSWRRVRVSRTLSNLNHLFLLYSRVARKIRLLGNSLILESSPQEVIAASKVVAVLPARR